MAGPGNPAKLGPAWKPGQSGNPAGRPVGARSKLSEEFIEDLFTVWRESGIDTLRRLVAEDPATFVNAVVKMMPKKLDVNVKANFVEYLRNLNNGHNNGHHLGNGDRPDSPGEAPLLEGQPGGVRH